MRSENLRLFINYGKQNLLKFQYLITFNFNIQSFTSVCINQTGKKTWVEENQRNVEWKGGTEKRQTKYITSISTLFLLQILNKSVLINVLYVIEIDTVSFIEFGTDLSFIRHTRIFLKMYKDTNLKMYPKIFTTVVKIMESLNYV